MKRFKLGEIFRTTSGGTPSRRIPIYYSGNIPWVKSGELESNIILDTEEKISNEAINNSSAKVFPKGTLLIALYGATIGKLAKLGIDAATNQAVCGIFENPEHDLNYLYWFLFHKRRNLIELGIGGAQPNISQTILKNLEIPLPSKPIQQAIVSKIEELFSELDKGTEILRTVQQQLKTYRQSVLKLAFEGKFSNNNVKEGELPEGWKLMQIKDITEMNPKIPDKENISQQMEVQFLPMKLVEELINKINLTEIRKYKDVSKGSYTPFINGDIIFAKVTPCMENGKIAIVDNLRNGIGFGSSEFHVIRVGDNLVGKYIFYYLVQDRFRHEAENAMTGAVGLRRVPKQFIENHNLPLPSIKEQHNIVLTIESRLSVADKMEKIVSQSLQQAESLRQSVLKKAFDGKLVVEQHQEEAELIPFERKVLAGKIIHLFHDHKYFGLTKFQKTFFVCENYAECGYKTNYLQERAGPYDRDFTLAFRKEMKEQDWFQEEMKVSMTHFVPGDNVGKLIKDYAKYFREKGNKIRFVLNLFKEKTLHESELIATLYAAWNNRVIKKNEVTLSGLIKDIYDWSKDKIKYKPDEIKVMYSWMQRVALIPTGFGKLIGPGN